MSAAEPRAPNSGVSELSNLRPSSLLSTGFVEDCEEPTRPDLGTLAPEIPARFEPLGWSAFIRPLVGLGSSPGLGRKQARPEQA